SKSLKLQLPEVNTINVILQRAKISNCCSFMSNGCSPRYFIKAVFIPFVILSQQLLMADPTVIPQVTLKQDKIKKNKLIANKTIINRKQIQKSAVINIGELLQQKQSVVRVISNSMDNNQTVLSIRGFGDNAVANTLILVDGFPLINASLF